MGNKKEKIYPIDAFEIFSSVKIHFNNAKFDAIRYNFKTGRGIMNNKKFDSNPHRFLFMKLANKFNSRKDLARFYSSYFIKDPRMWINEIVESPEIYMSWRKRNESLSYHFEEDIKENLIPLKGLFSTNESDSPYPRIIKKYLTNSISPETIVLINFLTGFLKKVSIPSDPFLWPDIKLKLEKYSDFVEFDELRIERILKKYL